jgi:uncharacterized protein (DUF2147 family)
MKKIVAALAISLFALCAVIAEDVVSGLWKSIDEKDGKVTAAWKIYENNGKLFGEIITVPGQADTTLAKECKGPYAGFPVSGDLTKRTVINTPFIYGLTKKSTGQWEGGNIVDPTDGKLYKCKVAFHAADGKKFKADTLEMRGEIGLGIGRSQFWARTTPEEVESLRTKS